MLTEDIMEKITYVAPEIEVVEVAVESGFAASGDSIDGWGTGEF